MSDRDPQDVSRLTDAITDESAIDWQDEKRSRPELSDTLDRLEEVESIFRGYRLFGRTRSGEVSAAAGKHPHSTGPPAGAPPTVPFSWGPLHVLEQIGEGTFGEVFRARDPSLEREVALKLWRETASATTIERLLLEGRRLARVRHPNVLVVYGADRFGNRSGMWTDLIRGQTLEEILERQGPFGARETALIGTELCRALAAVHGAGLIHRDVKTTNVMRERGGKIVLMDFGAVEEMGPLGVVRLDQSTVGTPLALAPELFFGEPAAPGTDLYALGVLLYRILTGAYPVEADTLEELRAKHRRNERVPLRERRPDLPSAFVLAVERAFARAEAGRYARAGDMERSLAEAAELAAEPGIPDRASLEPGHTFGAMTATLAPVAPSHHVPEVATRLLGRDREIRDCTRLLKQGRWLTIAGPRGCGKTRLALRLAETWLASCPGGVWYVDLEAVFDEARVTPALSAVLGIPERPGTSAIEAVAEQFGNARTLLVFDHCDGLLPAVARLGTALLERGPHLRVIAISQGPVGVEHERVVTISPFVRQHGDAGQQRSETEGAPRRAPFVGRQRERAVLLDAAERARLRLGGTMLLRGEAGLGKSRLLDEVRLEAELGGLLCLSGQCVFHGGRNFEPFLQALEEFARRFGPAGAGLRSTSSTLLHTLSAILDPGRHGTPEPRSPEQVWFLLDAVLKRIAKYETLILLLDDLQWADEGTLSLLNHLSRNLGSSRLLLVGAYRPEELAPADGSGRSLQDVIPLLSSQENVRSLSLEPLEPTETRALVERMLEDAGGGREDATAIHARALGNPFFTIEIVRDLMAMRGPESAAAAEASPGDRAVMPQTIADALLRRLARLSPEERDVLDVAAAEGETFMTGTLMAGTGLPRLALLKRVRALEQVHHLIMPSEDCYRFSHGLIRDVLLDAMPAELRREYHGVVADYLAQLHGDRPAYAAGIGHQMFEAHRFAEALPYLLQAAREARRLFLNDRALGFLKSASEAASRSSAPVANRGEILRDQSEVLLLLGRPDRGRAVAGEALRDEESAGDEAGIAAALESVGEAALAQGDLAAAEAALTRARERHERHGELRGLARCDQRLGTVATRRGDFEQAFARFTGALESLTASGDERAMARLRLDLGDVLYRRGDYDRALVIFEEAVRELRRLDERHDLARGLNRLGNGLFQSGRTDQALVRYQEAMPLMVRLGDLQGLARLEANVGNVHLVRGEAEQAFQSYRDALRTFREIGDRTGTGQTLMALGNACFTRGSFDEAAVWYRDSLGPREEMGDRWGIANSQDNLGVVEFHLGHWSSSLGWHESALRLRKELGDRPGCAEASLNIGSLLAVLGDLEGAATSFADAERVADELGDARKQARARLANAVLRRWRGDAAGSADLLQRASVLPIDDPAIRARLRLLEGLDAPSGPAGREQALREALEEARRARSFTEEATVRIAFAAMLRGEGRGGEARAEIEQAVELVRDRVPLLELHARRVEQRVLEDEPGRGEEWNRSTERIRDLVQRLSQELPLDRLPCKGFEDPIFPLP